VNIKNKHFNKEKWKRRNCPPGILFYGSVKWEIQYFFSNLFNQKGVYLQLQLFLAVLLTVLTIYGTVACNQQLRLDEPFYNLGISIS